MHPKVLVSSGEVVIGKEVKTLFELKTRDVKFFGETMKLIAEISPEEFYLWSEGKNLKLGSIDPSHVVLAEFSLSGKNRSMSGEIKDKVPIQIFKVILF
jgi:hypothetical protein